MKIRFKNGVINFDLVVDVIQEEQNLRFHRTGAYTLTLSFKDAKDVLDKIHSAVERGVLVLDLRQDEL